MIYAVGDSHAAITFAGIPEVTPVHLGPVTMRRVGHLEDDLLPAALAQLNPRRADTVILSFGEIDCRCYVQPLLEHRRGMTLDKLLDEWVSRYLERVDTLNIEADAMVMSVVPASPEARCFNIEFPVTGSDAERAEYMRVMNWHLLAGCRARGLEYLDMHTPFADEHGMLPLELSDGMVHVRGVERVRAALADWGLL